MRTGRWLIIMALGFVASGQIDFGVRGTAYGSSSDEARYQRFQDLRNGPFIDGFRFGNANDRRLFDVRAEHVGYRDQRYSANYNQ